ncbi:MAG TPA: hypothetical protein VIJ26_08730, partial [Thermoanaerobaculia bacterium]
RVHGGAVLVGVKATPCGWAYGPALTPDRGRCPKRSYREQVREPRSTNFRSPRFEGIAAARAMEAELAG